MYNLPILRQLILLLHWVLVTHQRLAPRSLGLGHNWTWGLAIIGLTIIVRLVLFPLTWKQFSSAQAMQAIQPKIKELQKKYKSDRAKLQQETMKLYQEHRVNPFASCLPILLQLPVFISLYAPSRARPAERARSIRRRSRRSTTRSVPVDPPARASRPVLHPARPLRGLAAHLHRAHARQPDRQVAEDDHAGHAHHLRVLPVPLPGRPLRVLGHHQRLDDRPAAPHPQGR